jgi:PAS domain S-box-containing protein
VSHRRGKPSHVAAVHAWQQTRYEGLVDQLDDAFVWEAAVDTRHVSYVSTQVEQLLGYTRQQCLDEPDWWSSHVHPEDRENLRQTFERALAEPGNQRCEHRCLASDGSHRWLKTSIHLVGRDDGAQHFQGVSRDITATKMTEEPDREPRSFTTATNPPIARCTLDTEHFLLGVETTLSANLEAAAVASAAARLGVPRLGDLCLVDLVAEDDQVTLAAWAHADPATQHKLDGAFGAGQRAPVFPQLVTETLAIGRSQQLPIVHDAERSGRAGPIARLGIRRALCVPLTLGTRRLGTLTFCMTGSRQPRDGDVALAEALARRITLAIERARLSEQARHAVELREQALAIISHDLRSPLATIVMAASILTDDKLARANPRAKTVAIDKILGATQRMERLVGDFRDFASIEAGHLSMVAKPHEIAGIIKEATANFDALAKKHQVNLTGEAAPDLPTIHCDRNRILQVLTNLMGNALKIVSPGDSVCLRAKRDGREAVFSVSDTGPGVAATVGQNHLLECSGRSPYAAYKGAGLGLALARGLVEAHHGRLWVESELGQGATFYFTVPLAEPPPTALELPGHHPHL